MESDCGVDGSIGSRLHWLGHSIRRVFSQEVERGARSILEDIQDKEVQLQIDHGTHHLLDAHGMGYVAALHAQLGNKLASYLDNGINQQKCQVYV